MAAKEKTRCSWVPADTDLYIAYHDSEWGTPQHDDRHLFEMVNLEGAQAGLSWITILRKRENYRKAFANFDAKKIVKYTPAKVEALMQNDGIIRNRLKINGTIENAKAFLAVQKEFGSFDSYIWSFTQSWSGASVKKSTKKYNVIPHEKRDEALKISEVMSKDLKKRGFKFMGGTIAFAYMQATGMVNDHTPGCFKYVK